MDNLAEKMNEFKILVVNLVLLPSKNLDSSDFEKEESDAIANIEELVMDPYWSDYVYFPDKHGLRDFVIEIENGVISMDKEALQELTEKVFSYKPISI